MEPRDRFFQTFCVLPEKEIRPGVTVTFSSLVDLSAVEAIRQAAKAAGHRKYSYTAFVVKALALAIREFDYANRRVFREPWLFFLGPRLHQFHACDIGVAVEVDMPGRESAAFVHILRDAERQSMLEIVDWLQTRATEAPADNPQWKQFSRMVERCPYWLSAFLVRLPCWFPRLWVKYRGAAAMISSPAKYGVDTVVAAWNWPLGVSFGYVDQRPVVHQGQIVARPTFQLVLNFDRRVMAGAQAARFFRRMVDLLENAATEMAPYLPVGDLPT